MKKKITIFLIVIVMLGIIISTVFINQDSIEVSQIPAKTNNYYSNNLEDRKEYETGGATSITISFENNTIETQKDLIFYIRTNKTINGRKIVLEENSKEREDAKESAILGKDGIYYYQYTFQTYQDSKITKIIINNLPTENITFYCWIKYDNEKYYPINMKNTQTGEDLKISTDTALIPVESTLTKEEIASLKSEDIEIMKQKWATKLGIDINDVDKYIDLYNAKGQGKLHKDGKVMKNSKNEEVMLNGVGLFHLLDYGYMYNQETLSALKYWGINCIRIPAYLEYKNSSNFDTVTPVDRGLDTAYDEYIEEMDRIIDIATEEGLYCMVDFHILKENGDILNWKAVAEKFFTHFAQKYGSQSNILYELANEPFSTPNSSLISYVKDISSIIKNYDANPILIVGYTYESGLSGCYQALKTNGINDVFISYHYYNGEDITSYKNLYETTDIPLIYSEWGNSDTKANGTDEYFTEMTTQYLNWWSENNIANSAWMLCHGNYSYSLWNKDLGSQSEILQYGLISDKYLSEYGKLVFEKSLDNTIAKIKENPPIFDEDDNTTQENTVKEDNTTANRILPNAGTRNILIGIISLTIIISIISFIRYKKIF